MRFYFVSNLSTSKYTSTLADAHAVAKAMPRASWQDVQIDAVTIDCAQSGVLAILNAESTKPDDMGFRVVCSWHLSDRGGLKEGEA